MKNILVGLMFCAALPSVGNAQRSVVVGVGAGEAIPTGRLSNAQIPGFSGTIDIFIASPESWVGLRIDANQDRLGGAKVAGVRQPRMVITSGTLDLTASISTISAKPYLMAGLGEYFLRADSVNTTTVRRVGYDLGGGLTFRFFGRAAFVESRVHIISQRGSAPLHVVPIIFGFLF